MTSLEKLQQLNEEERFDFLLEAISKWAGLESRDGSYIHDLTRTKEGYQYGTVGLDDFVEWNEDRVAEVTSEFLEWLDAEVVEH